MNLSQVQTWIRLVFRKRPARPRRRLGSNSRLFLECLETRNLLSTVVWINPNGGDWDTASNWLDTTTGTNHVPTANDNAVIAISGITVTHTSVFSSDTVNSLASQATLSVSGGSLTFNNFSTTQDLILSGGTVNAGDSLAVANLTQNGGTLTGAGNVTIDQALSWTGGTMSGSGDTEVEGNAEVGGDSAFGPTLSARTLDNFGTLTVDNSSSLLFADNATLNNQSGAQLVLEDTAALGNFFGSSGSINNAGKLIRSGLNNTSSTIDVALDNTGTVDVQAGTLDAEAGLTNEGTFTLESGALATLTGGSNSGEFKLQDGSQLSLAGSFSLLDGSSTKVDAGSQLELTGDVTQLGGAAVTLASNSILNVTPNFSSQNYILEDGASVTGQGVVVLSNGSSQLTVNGAASIQNLTLENGTATVNAGDSLEVANLTQSGGTLTGAGNVTIDKLLDWTGGTMSGSGDTEVEGNAEIGGGSSFAPTLSARTLDNFGTLIVDNSSSLLFADNATLNNQSGAQLVLEDTAALGNFFGSSGSINNAGKLIRSGLNNTSSTIDVALDNTGTVDVQAGTLDVTADLTNEGTFTLEPGALATVNDGNSSVGNSSGSFQLKDGSQLSIAGTFSLLDGSTTQVDTGSQLELTGDVTQLGGAAVTLASNSILNVTPNFSSQNYILEDGASVTGQGVVVLSNGSSQLTVNGAASIQNLTLENGTATVNAGDSLEVANLTQSGGTLTGAGNVAIDKVWSWTGGTMSGTGQTINNGTATLGNSPFGTTLNQRTINNMGNATLLDGDAIAFQNNAVWNNLVGSTLVLSNTSSLGNFFGSSGTLNNAGLISDTGPTSQANIDLSSGVSNSGTLDLQGILNVTGPYTQTADGTLTIVFGTSGTNGEVKVNGQASLDGTLNVNTPKGFSPTDGQTFTILTFSSVVGDFSTFSGLNLGHGQTLTPSENSTTYTLTVTAS